MWDLEHPPRNAALAERYQIDWMLPSECADRLAAGQADIGLVPIASLALNPSLRALPGCTIASKDRVRSLLLVRRRDQSLKQLRTIAADTASRTTVAYTRILLQKWGNPDVRLMPMAADLDAMLERADAALIIGDPALIALENRIGREERTGEELAYHDLAHEWRKLTGLPFVSAVWAAGPKTYDCLGSITRDLIASRDNGIANIEQLVAEWAQRLPLPASVIDDYLRHHIHYVLDQECLEGTRGFFRLAAEAQVLPPYDFSAAHAN